MGDILSVPRDVLTRMRDELVRLPDWSDVGSSTFILYHQIGSILDPDPRYVTPISVMATR